MSLLSVVTIHRNDFDNLRRTLSSMTLILSREEVEWIVIDGNSNWSEEKSLLKDVEEYSKILVIESDNGIYDAMNKGTNLANGEYIHYLNAGDVFSPNVILEALENLRNENVAGVVCFDSSEGVEMDGFNLKTARNESMIWYGMTTHHQAMIFRRSILGSNPYDETYKIAADYALVCQLFTRGIKFRLIHKNLCMFDLTGVSSQYFWDGLKEQQFIRKEILKIPVYQNILIYLIKYVARLFRNIFPFFYSIIRYKSKG